MVNLIFVFNRINTQKLCSETALKGKLNCNKYIHLLITPREANLVWFGRFGKIVVRTKVWVNKIYTYYINEFHF